MVGSEYAVVDACEGIPSESEATRMLGGGTFQLDGTMAVGVSSEELMVRVGPEAMDAAVAHDGVRLFGISASV